MQNNAEGSDSRLAVADGAHAPSERVATDAGAIAQHQDANPKIQDAGPPAFEARLQFDGTGAEYFRIWVVNLALTVFTLGIYSAWAKVRKARWFAQHTSLLGDRFDFWAPPRQVLAGRAVALVLLLLWTYAFKWSPVAGFVVLALLLAVGPILFASAQRFRLSRTRWRGLAFGFDLPRRTAYAVVVPLLLIWTATTVAQALNASTAWILGCVGVVSLALPGAHALLKHTQHNYARFGSQRFSFERAVWPFYGTYLLGLLALLFAGFAIGVFAAVVGSSRASGGVPTNPSNLWFVIGTFGGMALTWVLAWPFLACRMQRVVWPRTHWGAVSFRGDMGVWKLLRLSVSQTLLTILTAGLYWPFAAVAIAKYRVESLVLVSATPLDAIVATSDADGQASATGDASADLFGLDIGW